MAARGEKVTLVIQGEDANAGVGPSEPAGGEMWLALRESGIKGNPAEWKARTADGRAMDGGKGVIDEVVDRPARPYLGRGPGRGGGWGGEVARRSNPRPPRIPGRACRGVQGGRGGAEPVLRGVEAPAGRMPEHSCRCHLGPRRAALCPLARHRKLGPYSARRRARRPEPGHADAAGRRFRARSRIRACPPSAMPAMPAMRFCSPCLAGIARPIWTTGGS